MFYVMGYADDLTAFISTFEQLKKLESVILIYGKASGARLNKTKSKCLLFGKWKEINDTHIHGFTIVKDGVKILGIYYGDENFQKKN